MIGQPQIIVGAEHAHFTTVQLHPALLRILDNAHTAVKSLSFQRIQFFTKSIHASSLLPLEMYHI